MPEPKAQLVDPQGPIDVPGLSVTGVTTATGGFVGKIQGSATGLASTTANLSVGIITATKFQGNTTGNVSGLADDTNINVGIITSTSFTGDLVGNAAGLSTTTANIKAGIMSATSFAGNFTGVASGITGTPNIVVGIMTGTLKGDGSTLTGIAATNWIANNVTANSFTTTVDFALGNVVKFTQSADTTVSFANTGTSNIVSFIRTKDATSTERTLTWPSAIKWNGGSAPTLDQSNLTGNDVNVITLLTRDEGVTWYGWETISDSTSVYQWWTTGYNLYGELGQNNRVYYSSPVQIPGAWTGFNKGNASHVDSYAQTSIGAKADGTLWAWGYNNGGQLGLNDIVNRSSPVQIPGTTWSGSYINSGRNTLVVKTDGTLWVWGYNYNGSLGLNSGSGHSGAVSSPTQVPGTTWNMVASGPEQGYGLKTDGTLWSWGYGMYGQLGVNDILSYSSPIQIPGTTWSTVSGGQYNAAAIKTDGTLWMWGQNSQANLAQNNKTKYSSPVQVPGTTWRSVRSTEYVTHATKTDGTFWVWGNNGFGMLGLNNTTAYSSPIQIPGTTWSEQHAVASYSAVAIKTDGTTWGWGNNEYGELGQNATVRVSSPIQIPGKDADFVQSKLFRSSFFIE